MPGPCVYSLQSAWFEERLSEKREGFNVTYMSRCLCECVADTGVETSDGFGIGTGIFDHGRTGLVQEISFADSVLRSRGAHRLLVRVRPGV